MEAWALDTARAVTAPQEVQVVTRRGDGTLRRPRTIWVVGDGGRVFVRSEKGREADWFRWALATGTGQLISGDATHDVRLTEVTVADVPRVDAAYRAKYGQHAAVVDRLQAPRAQAATLELHPQTGPAPGSPHRSGERRG